MSKYYKYSHISIKQQLVEYYSSIKCASTAESLVYKEAKKLVAFAPMEFFTKIKDLLGLGLKEILKFFKNPKIIKFFSKVKWSFKKLFEIVKKGYKAYQNLQKVIFEYIAKNKVVKWTTQKLEELDEWIKKHPKTAKIGGLVVAGLLIFIWLNMSFTGDFIDDFSFDTVLSTLNGNYTLSTIFGGVEGTKLLTLFATGAFLGLSFPWPGSGSIRFLIAIVTTLSKKIRQKLKIKNKRK